ncbi:hypothetical protein FRC08_016324 [Ceratobasidium sp. 394]|nr:hypothetical protein FRC08_016324 [Ceratobasidium sp. 394]
MLRALPRLRHLTLTPMAKSFGELFNGMEGCGFALRSLTVSYHTQPSFARFLQKQPSITHLRLFDPDTEPPRAYKLVSSINEPSATEPFLPHLEYVSADPRVLVSLVVGRPVSEVEITIGACLSNEQDELNKLVTALTQTAVPITSITHTLRTVRIHLWGNRFLQQLKETSVCSSLRSLAVCLPQIMRPVFLLRTSANIRPIAHISQLFAKELGEFSCLEAFELSLHGFRLSDPSAEEIAESFGGVDKLETWKSFCRTLQRVVLYGTELK